DIVAGALERTGADPSTILLEVVEAAVTSDLEASAATLRRLEALGVRLALDDFGTGPSSLRALQRLPVSDVKVDRSLVERLPGDEQAVALLSATVAPGAAVREGAERDAGGPVVVVEAQRGGLVAPLAERDPRAPGRVAQLDRRVVARGDQQARAAARVAQLKARGAVGPEREPRAH